MNWDALGALGEWIGAAGVIISIIFLAQQVKSNTRTLKARAAYDASNSWGDINEQIAQAILFDPATPGRYDFARDTMQLWQADADPAAFAPDQMYPYAMLWRSHFLKLEAQYFLFKHGLLDAELWEKVASFWAGAVQLPVLRAWWGAEQQTRLYSEEFCRAFADTKPRGQSLAGTGSQVHFAKS
jgi:hypothetical protein